MVVEVAFFLCSYAPLFILLAIRFTTTWLTITFAALAAAGLIVGFGVIRRYRKITPTPWTLRKVEDRGGETVGYLATYLLPFVTVAEPSWRDLVGYALFLLVVGVIYVRSSLVQLNPTLYLARWRIGAIEIGDSGWTGFVISRRSLRKGEELVGVRMTDRRYIDYRLRDDDS